MEEELKNDIYNNVLVVQRFYPNQVTFKDLM